MNTIFESVKKTTPCLFIFFGGTGDLTHRKLLPAIYKLKKKKLLPENFAVVSIGRRDKNHEIYRNDTRLSLEKFTKTFDQSVWKELKKTIYYYKLHLDQPDQYTGLNNFLNELDKKHNTKGNRVFYLATSPDFFGTISDNLKKYGFIDKKSDKIYRIVVEKPFGSDAQSARNLNKALARTFTEEEVFRIDHYLGKEAVQNLFALRFANTIFQAVWNCEHIDNIQISVTESLGVGTRGGYYDKAGAIRDMIQNHLLQLLTLVAMEPPKTFDTNDIKNEKAAVLNAIKPMTQDEVKKNVILGQYEKGENNVAFRKEDRVNPKSRTETYAALKLKINNKRWHNTCFYLRTGKALKSKASEIVVYFKNPKYTDFFGVSLKPDVLVLRLQPNEGVYLRINSKKPGNDFELQRVSMDFCQNCLFDMFTPEAYEKLIYDVLLGQSNLFNRWDGVEQAWEIVDPITKYWESTSKEPYFYKGGSWGPKEANKLLEKEHHHWREPM